MVRGRFTVSRGAIGRLQHGRPDHPCFYSPRLGNGYAYTSDPGLGTHLLDKGLAFTVLLAGLNQFFFFRYPSVSISNFVAVLLSLPLCRAWAAVRVSVHVRRDCDLIPGSTPHAGRTELAYLRDLSQPWSIFDQGARTPNNHVYGWCRLYVRRISYVFHVLTGFTNSGVCGRFWIVTGDRYVSCFSSVQTDIVAVQRVYYNQTYNFSCEYSQFDEWLHGVLTIETCVDNVSSFTIPRMSCGS